MFTCLYVYVFICLPVYMFTCRYVYVYICLRVCVSSNDPTQMHTHNGRFAQTCVRKSRSVPSSSWQSKHKRTNAETHDKPGRPAALNTFRGRDPRTGLQAKYANTCTIEICQKRLSKIAMQKAHFTDQKRFVNRQTLLLIKQLF